MIVPCGIESTTLSTLQFDTVIVKLLRYIKYNTFNVFINIIYLPKSCLKCDVTRSTSIYTE